MEINKIYNVSCLDGIKDIDFPIHMVVTSPPYNVDLGNNKKNKRGYDKYDDNLSLPEYLEFISRVFREVYYKLSDDGRVCINIGALQNGSVPMDSYYNSLMESIGYKPYTHIIWNKSQVGNRTSWGSFLSPSCPSFPTPFEHLLIYYKKDKKLLRKGETDLTKDEFIEWSLALWNFKPETSQKKLGHPAMFPEELPKRLIKMLSYIGDTVLDPFSGAGTTALVAKKLKRSFVGFEISEEYCKIANQRLDI